MSLVSVTVALLACTPRAQTTTAPSADLPAPAPSAAPPTVIVEVPSTADAVTVTADAASIRPLHAGRVLLSTAGSPAWAMGPVLFRDANRYHEKWQIERAVDLAALPPELRQFAGATLDLYGPRGRVCTVEIDTLTIEAHLSMQYINGEYDDPGDAALWKALSNDEDYEAAVLLVASFPDDPSCAEAVWARDASLPAPELLVLADDGQDHAPLLTGEHRRALESDAGKKFTHDYQAYAADPEFQEEAVPWSSASEGHRQVWVDSGGAARFVALSFGTFGFTPCHWQGPIYSYVRQIDDNHDNAAEVSFEPLPVAVFDANLDGRYERLIVEHNGDFDLVTVVSAAPTLRVELSLPDGSYVWC